MKSNFDKFIEKIPQNIHSYTDSYLGKNLAVFIPKEFVIEIKMKMMDYNFVIFHTTPPPVKIGNIKYQFKKGSFICFEPGEEVIVNPTSSVGKISYISIYINKEFFEKIAHQIIEKGKIKLKKEDNAYSHLLLDLIGLFIEELISFGNHTLMAEIIEKQIVIQLLRDFLPNNIIHKKHRFTDNSNDNSYIEKAILYMQEYYSSNITISEICNNIFISPYHFQRIFRKHMKQTPYRYLMGMRVDIAKEMLVNGKSNIQEIARICGFTSTSHFSAVFKRIEGDSPSEYRKNRTKNDSCVTKN